MATHRVVELDRGALDRVIGAATTLPPLVTSTAPYGTCSTTPRPTQYASAAPVSTWRSTGLGAAMINSKSYELFPPFMGRPPTREQGEAMAGAFKDVAGGIRRAYHSMMGND